MLTRWTSLHPIWNEHVGSVCVTTDDGVVFIDPLAPPEKLGQPDHVLITTFWHDRSARDLAATHVWSTRRAAGPLRNRGLTVTRFVEGEFLPGGIVAIQTARVGEVVYWLPSERALVVGDVLLGAGAKPGRSRRPLRLCPEAWLGSKSGQDLRASLRPLLELPIERIFVSHGEPVISNAHEALQALLRTKREAPRAS